MIYASTQAKQAAETGKAAATCNSLIINNLYRQSYATALPILPPLQLTEC
jgi:hypothetical protein